MNKVNMEFKSVPIEDIKPNPKNWRKHPAKQKRLLKRTINEVGWVGAILWNKKTGHIIDGELRYNEVLSSGGKEIQAIVIDVSEKVEEKILATFDKITIEGTDDKDLYMKLINEIEFDDEMLAVELQLDIKNDIDIEGAEMELVPELFYKHNYVVLVFKDNINWEWAKEHYGLEVKRSRHGTAKKFCHAVDGDKYVKSNKV